tara:strand:- start:1779 stop:2144 length:366 start_codon:yes stop_codon:yes gene_type:complete
MKLLKYIFFIIILISCIVFIIQLDKLNTNELGPVMIKFPYLTSIENYENGIQVWEAIILTLSIGVFVGFLIALFQLVAQKSEIISLKSKNRRLVNELDSLRNQSIEDDIEITDDINNDMNI